MRLLMLCTGAAFVLGSGFAAAEDPKPDPKSDPKSDPKPASELTTKEPPPKAPTFPGYTFVADAMGEVVKADDKTVKLRITWFVPQSNNKRQKLSSNNRNFRNPFAHNQGRPPGQWKEQHHDYDLDYMPQSLVRFKTLPPKLDEKGKKVAYTTKEYDELRAPLGVTGYAASRSDVVPGSYVEVFVIRDKTIPAEKATDADLRIKHVVIWGKDPNPPKDISGATPPKKN